MTERNGQFNFSRANLEMEPAGEWVLQCDKCDLSVSTGSFKLASETEIDHKRKNKSHHVEMNPHPARVR